MLPPLSRRRFLGASSASVVGVSTLQANPILSGLMPVGDVQVQANPQHVTFRPEIEPLVRLIEQTPRDELLEVIGKRVRDGLEYQSLLGALLLAGIRNVQPRPAVGFKFHAVLVVHSAHLASVASAPEDRWLPIFWALDQFKSSQARDIAEGDWTMSAVQDARVPSPEAAVRSFEQAMQSWDEEAADVAAAAVARTLSADQVLDLLAKFVARDFRAIGHKAIYLANSWRTLQTIGWQHAEPVVRSLAYAALNHVGEPNPATSDLQPDRSWRENLRFVESIPPSWNGGTATPEATSDLLSALRDQETMQVTQLIVGQLTQGVSPTSIFDALHVGAAELLMRQNGIVALHAVTTTNAMRFLFDHVGDDHTRRLLILQAAAFLPQFRDNMARRGNLDDVQIDRELAEENAAGTQAAGADLAAILPLIRQDSLAAARGTARWLAAGNDPQRLIDATRRLIFLKGDDSHDYKFSSAVTEDYHLISPAWRNPYLAASTYRLRSPAEPDIDLVSRIRAAI